MVPIATEGSGADFVTSVAAYGTQEHQLAVSHQYRDVLHSFALVSFTHSDNDFPYVDRNNTPYNPDDDRERHMENSQYTSGTVLVHPRVSLGSIRTLVTNVSYTYSKAHLPAPEGRTNRTAYYDENRVTVTARLNDDRDGRVLNVEPAIGYTFTDGLRFWTSLDTGVGASHATSTAANSFAEVGTREQTLSVPVYGTVRLGDLFTIEPTLHLQAADINPTVNTTEGHHGDWHSREASLSAAADVQLHATPLLATVGGSVAGVYSETEGGLDGASLKTVLPSDTTTVVWSARAGVSAGLAEERLLLYSNIGRFSNQPSLRERYGASGASNPNPTLVPETGVAVELGAKARGKSLFAEVCGFYVQSDNKIITVFDGRQSASINCDGARAYGVETWVSWIPLSFLAFDSRATFQHTENLAREYNWYGRRLPNEPGIDLFETVTVGPLRGFSLRYGLDMKSFYYRDPSNVAERVPEETYDGEPDFWDVHHSIVLEYRAPRHLTLRVSAVNVTNELVTEGRAASTSASGYDWVLYPENQWRATLTYSF